MKPWPRTLFHRNLLLFAGLIVAGQLVNALLFRQMVLKPRIDAAAEAMGQDMRGLAAGLRALPPEARQGFVDRFNASASQADQAAANAPPPEQRLSLLERRFLAQVSERLAGTNEAPPWRFGSGRLLELRVAVDGTSYWVALPGLRPVREFTGTWLAASLASALLAIAGAWLIQRRLNRPLQALVASAQVLGRGEQPAALPQDSPEEIATVSRSFNEMAASLRRNEQERGLMLAGLSHDLRTPLAKMRLATEMLRGQADGELLATLDRSIDAVDRLLAQFLDFTRAGHEADEPPAESDLNALVEQTLALCATDGVSLALGPVRRHPLRAQGVARMLMNLVTNAQRHGGPPVEVATGESLADGLWLEVRDRGPGIPPDRAQALKQPFARGDAARGGPVGAGLGLAIVERIAKGHGARFELLPHEGGGLVARVQWPPGSLAGLSPAAW
jgi:two-component system, OmpR family, osmolarity sensor histidine kinase EnvZ